MKKGWWPALALGVGTGLWGIGWGLPGAARLRAFPTPVTPEVARRFAESWSELYVEIQRSHRDLVDEPATYVQGVSEFPPGWDFPPGLMVNGLRSMLTQSCNPDEKKSFIIMSHMRPWKLDFKPMYVFYGGAFIYPLGVFLKAASLLRLVTAVPDLAHYLQHPDDMGRLYLWGRLFILLFHLATMWLLYDLGRRLSGRRTGLLAAAFFCLSPIATVNSHLLKPHPYAAFWCLAALRYALLAAETGALREYLLSGLCCGMSAGAAFSFACFAWLPAFPWLERLRTKKAEPRELRRAALAGAAAAGVFLLTNPYFAFSYRDYLWDILLYAPKGAARAGIWRGVFSILAGAWDALGPALYLASLAGLAVCLLRKERQPRLLAFAFLGLFVTLWAIFGRFYSYGLLAVGVRYYYPLFGLACLFAAHGLSHLPKPAAWLAASAVLMDAGLRSGVYLANMSAGSGPRSTRSLAADWIEAHVPPGAAVGLSRLPEPAHTPPFRYDRYRIVIFSDADKVPKERYPEYLVLDQENLEPVKGLVERGGYKLLKSFPPICLGWACPTDPSFYANVGIYAFRR